MIPSKSSLAREISKLAYTSKIACNDVGKEGERKINCLKTSYQIRGSILSENVDGYGHMSGYDCTFLVLITAYVFGLFF